MTLRYFLPSIVSFVVASSAAWAETAKVDFVKQVLPILETNCVSCHKPSNKEENGEFDITTKATALEGGDHGPSFVAGQPDKSRLYTDLIRPDTDKRRMPPPKNHDALAKEEIELIKNWIAQGAEWDEAVVLKQRPKDEKRPPSIDTLELVQKMHPQLVTGSKEQSEAEMKAYKGSIPKIGKSYDMTPIKGGSFLMGSPESENGRKPDEGPQVKVKIDPFWMGTYEVSWDQYMPFMITADSRYKDGSKKQRKPTDTEIDAISSPTTPYVDMTFGMGQEGYPAISMTEHAANKYCQWLSAQTGHFYRLPTEAEWEYAARAGTTTAYFFGEDADKLADYAWFADNSDTEGTGQGTTQPIGKKKPNPWGLYDIYGNVNEWVLDQYDEGFYASLGSAEAANPFNKPKTLFPRVVRGGGFKSVAENCRSAKRRGSAESWKQQDPQLPKSIWYHTDAQFLGFRLVRPLKVPSAEEMHAYWNLGVIPPPPLPAAK
jgi:formylglycine-generating enzyme required for sulfatase activity